MSIFWSSIIGIVRLKLVLQTSNPEIQSPTSFAIILMSARIPTKYQGKMSHAATELSDSYYLSGPATR